MNEGFEPSRQIARLEGFAQTVPAVVSVIDPADASWRPDDHSWSVLEIVCHLVDEEVEDFRTRVLSTLNDPTRAWPKIDPEGWPKIRDYQSADLKTKLDAFVSLRHESIELIRAIPSPDWARAFQHPKVGPVSAGYLLSCWCAHDALHLRQLSRRLLQLAQRDAGGDALQYAGTW
jgi:hypothetical protein